ncbi:MAG: hypothetical protein QTN59_03545 [Candidatus Electrothrix communis]|nr:hypothetical protein [Desulfobulbus sp. US4]WLE97913.1 MAG: hypothetical protein QTN59_03545 [Candidatus Electrothrix communis]
MKARQFLLCGHMTGLAVFLFIVIPLAAQAGVQTAVVVDGQYDEWDMDKDGSTPMGSDRSYTGEALPSVYLRYDSITNTIFVLVLQKDSMRNGQSKPVVNIYSLGQNLPVDLSGAGKISNFSWVMDGGNRVGWEGSFQHSPGTYDCETALDAVKRTKKVSGRKTASEVKVLDTGGLLFKCD